MSAPRSIRLLALALALCGLALPAAHGVEAGQAAPDFSAPSIGGDTLSLSDYRGKVVMLDFWASWCGPCAQSLPALDALRDEFAGQDFQVLAVNVDRKAKAARTFLRLRPVGYPSVLDPKAAIPGRFGVETMPTSFLIDRDGVVRHVHRGFRKADVDGLRQRIQSLLAAGR